MQKPTVADVDGFPFWRSFSDAFHTSHLRLLGPRLLKPCELFVEALADMDVNLWLLLLGFLHLDFLLFQLFFLDLLLSGCLLFMMPPPPCTVAPGTVSAPSLASVSRCDGHMASTVCDKPPATLHTSSEALQSVK